MTGDQGRVSAQAPGVTVGFGIATVGGNTVGVRLIVEDDEIRVVESGARAAVERRHDLNMPELPPYGRNGGG